MIPLTLNNNEYLLVEVPEDAQDINNAMVDHQIEFSVPFTDKIRGIDCIILREYWGQKFEIISLLKDLTEEQAASIVEWDYVEDDIDSTTKLSPYPALESFSSFLRSHGVDETRNYLILLKL